MPFSSRLVVLLLAQGAMVLLTIRLQDHYEPATRIDLRSPLWIASFAALTSAPMLIGLFARSVAGVLLVGLTQVLSPLLLVPSLSSPPGDLSLAIGWWWGPVPLVALAIVVVDRLIPQRLGRSGIDGQVAGEAAGHDYGDGRHGHAG